VTIANRAQAVQDRPTDRPLYRFIEEDLLRQITEGLLEPGQAIPPERELCKSYGVSRITVRQAVRELERRIIFKVLQANNWNRKKAARSLNISYRALLYKIREAGLGSMGSSTTADSTASAD